jgi:hypothetical protein
MSALGMAVSWIATERAGLPTSQAVPILMTAGLISGSPFVTYLIASQMAQRQVDAAAADTPPPPVPVPLAGYKDEAKRAAKASPGAMEASVAFGLGTRGKS